MPWRFRNIPAIELRAAIISIVTSVVLLAIKFFAYWLTESSAIFSDAVESIVNVLAAVIALWAISLAHKPADEDHPYGHGKVEFMSAGLEGGMILMAAVFIFIRTADVLFFHDLVITRIDLGLVLIATSLVINAVVGFALIRTGRKQGSLALEADGHHLLSDAITSIAVLIGLWIAMLTGWAWADPIAAGLIAVYIAVTGYRLLRKSFAGLMDEQDRADNQKLIDILNSHIGDAAKPPRICSFHKLRHRHSGRYHWVDFHIMFPQDMDVAEAHRAASQIEYEMEQMLGEGNATAHIEPCGDDACANCAKR